MSLHPATLSFVPPDTKGRRWHWPQNEDGFIYPGLLSVDRLCALSRTAECYHFTSRLIPPFRQDISFCYFHRDIITHSMHTLTFAPAPQQCQLAGCSRTTGDGWDWARRCFLSFSFVRGIPNAKGRTSFFCYENGNIRVSPNGAAVRTAHLTNNETKI